MTSPLHLFSEIVQPTGGLAGSGAVRVLGRPKLSALSLAVRETVQNSWDARKANKRVKFTIERRSLGPESVKRFRREVFPGAADVQVPVVETMRENSQILILSDEGTVGLEGPVRADEVREDEPRRFVDFFRNIGSHQDVVGSGGTYGFGKTSLYRLSLSRAIVAFTRCKPAPREAVVSRLMAAAIGPSCRVSGRLLTGRHWWGDSPSGKDPVVDPLVGDEADELARSMGMYIDGSATGTSIAVLSPDIESQDEFREEIVETLLFNFWPKMLDRDGSGPDIDFTFIDEDESVEIMDPRAHPKIAPFVHAYSALRHSTRAVTSRAVTVEVAGRAVDVGHVAYTRTHSRPETAERKKRWEPFGGLSHHVCLLRTPELVVKYERTQPPIGLQAGYAAVFRCLDEHNDVFADSEPPAHDEWEPSSLERRDRELVNRTLRELRQIMKDVASGGASDSEESSSATPLGGLATFLGELLDGVNGDGPEVEAPQGAGATSASRTPRALQRPKVEVQSSEISASEQYPDHVVANVTIQVSGGRAGSRIRVRAEAGVQTAEGLEGEAPENAPTVGILAWRDEHDQKIGGEDEVVLMATTVPRRLSVAVRVPGRVLGALKFSCSNVEGA